MRRLVTLPVFFFTIIFCNAQAVTDTVPVNIAAINEDSSILNKAMVFADSTSSLAVSDILNQAFSALHLSRYWKNVSPGSITCTFYLKFLVCNTSEKEKPAYLYISSRYKETELYKIDPEPKIIDNADSIAGYLKFTLAPGEKCYLLAKLKPLKSEYGGIKPYLINADFINIYREYLMGHKNELQIIGLILSGVLLMMILFMITNFIISRKMEFIYNALYSLCMFLLIYLNSVLARISTSFSDLYFNYFDFFLLMTGTVFYISFVRKFLNTKTDLVILDRILKYSERFILILLCVYTYLNFFTETYLPQYYLENSMKFFILGIGITFIYLALKRKNILFNYIAAGNSMLVLFSSISLGVIWAGIKAGPIYKSALFYYYTGIILELAFFLLGLAYKNRKELIQKVIEQEALKLEAEKLEFESQLAVIKAQQEERNRISADMHDDLGAGMTTISLYSELAKSKLTDNPIPEIDKISSSANDLLNKMNAIIWSMSSSNDSLGNMIAYIRSYALEFFENTGIKCSIHIPENLPNLEVVGEIRRNVFLVVKEALNNILKHSKATEVEINLVMAGNEISLYLQDNGTGIDLDKLRQFGNGLRNMKKRMADVGIEFSIENKNGTLITLRRKVEQPF